MKTTKVLAIFILLAMIHNFVQAQYGVIDTIIMVPTNPTSNDSITFLINTGFPFWGCRNKTHNINIENHLIRNLSQYCIGNYTMTCDDVDSIKIPQLPYGNYVFRYVMHSTTQLNGCQIYYPADSIEFTFTVSNPYGIDYGLPSSNQFNVYKIAGNNSIKIIIKEFKEAPRLIINNLFGQSVFQTVLFDEVTDLKLDLPNGIYLFALTNQNKRQIVKVIIPNNH